VTIGFLVMALLPCRVLKSSYQPRAVGLPSSR
jgi:hypothetical protein